MIPITYDEYIDRSKLFQQKKTSRVYSSSPPSRGVGTIINTNLICPMQLIYIFGNNCQHMIYCDSLWYSTLHRNPSTLFMVSDKFEHTHKMNLNKNFSHRNCPEDTTRCGRVLCLNFLGVEKSAKLPLL